MRILRLTLLTLVVLTMTVSYPALASPGSAGQAAGNARPALRLNTDRLAAPTPAERQASATNLNRWLDGLMANPAGRPTTSAEARQRQAQWTVMIYLAADNDLEEYGIGDVNEMEVVGSTTNVNVVVQMDRAPGYDSTNGNWTDARRLYITRDRDVDRINSEVVETLPETNTGDPAVLADFVTWTMDNFPAQRYALILWDHGGSWLGVATDSSSRDNDLSMPELDEALSRIGHPLDLIGFDACLMGGFEVYRTVAPYAEVAVAAEETIPGFGWEYATPLQALARNPGMDAEALGSNFVDAFVAFYTDVVTYYDAFDLGAVRLAEADQLASAIDSFVTSVRANPAAVLSAIADARNNTLMFGGFDDPQYFDIWSAADLAQFMRLLSTLTREQSVAQAARNVVSAVEGMVINHLSSSSLAAATGMTIYFPRNLNAYTQYGFSDRFMEERPGGENLWPDFLDTFYGTATTTVPEAPQVRILGTFPAVASIHQPAAIQMEISGRDIVDVAFGAALKQADGTSILIEYQRLVSRTTTTSGEEVTDWADGVFTRTFNWDTEMPVISDGTVETPALLIQNRTNPGSAVVDGRFLPQSGDPVDAQLVYDLAAGTVKTVWGVRETANGYVPYELAINNGDQFQPYWLYLDADNNLQPRPADVTLTFGDAPFTYRLMPAPTGSYTITIVAENVTGATSRDSADINVNNTSLDPTQRGFTDPEFGLNFLYPATWIEPRFIPTDEGGRLFTGDPATGIVLSVLPYDGVRSAQDVAQQVINSWNALQDAQLVDQQPVTLGSYDAYVVDYTYKFNGEDRSGVVLAVYLPERRLGYGFDVDSPANQIDTATQAFQLLVNSVSFFDTQTELGESDWVTATLSGGQASFSVPAGWVEQRLENWSIYHAPGDEATFVAVQVSPTQGLSNEALATQYLEVLQQSDYIVNVEIYAAEPYFIANETWYLVGFTYTNQSTGVLTAGAYFVTTVGRQEYVFWLETSDAAFDQTFNDTFSVMINSFAFGG